ncbi:cytochrome c biogenesis CcdA family protein [Hippea maritima]|uniref:Cytochrome c biogenesis protein transmembrane region n=1 Tax=Hippea maritima (strain ATCC 700847 / DSM 10411 / MH2) TaxID=760142 RepID=F2LUW5_HIPMA|nr:cytochrome c biogenesis CcdA family protein [Hippea maritima]AEA33570.1 cytochrome c biogenesis protein transmembrane region [Hippea maritima DSM 10411]
MSISLMWGSFFAGILSFFSPCIFPLIPVYISFVTGHSLEDLKSKSQTQPLIIFAKTTVFIFGFALIFITMGAASSSIGTFLLTNKILFAKISGFILIFFGLQLSGLINIKILTQTKRLTACMPSHGFISSFVFGVIFAFGWSPCVGPMLSSILLLAADANSVKEGVILLSLYSLGIGLPFLAFSFSINYFFKVSKALKRLDLLQKASGVMLILAGAYLIYNGGF